jgi:hypothetical protein
MVKRHHMKRICYHELVFVLDFLIVKGRTVKFCCLLCLSVKPETRRNQVFHSCLFYIISIICFFRTIKHPLHTNRLMHCSNE